MIRSILANKVPVLLLMGWLLPVSGAAAPAPVRSDLPEMELSGTGGTDDPAYALYREGYRAILEERWVEARKHFDEMKRKFPDSRYRDEADYWTAFSWKHEDEGKARAAYEKIIREHPESAYLGDAIADLRMLEIEAALTRAPQPPPALQPSDHELRIRMPEELQRIEHEIRLIARMQDGQQTGHVMVIREGDTLLARLPRTPLRITVTPQPDMEPDVQIRLDALNAMSAGRRDGSTFDALHEIATDAAQPVPIRTIALNNLAGFSQKDPGAVFLAVAQRDTNEAIQRVAIELFARTNRPRSDRTSRLIDLFHKFERSDARRDRALSTTLFAIAAIGDDRATDFLASIARSDKAPALRSDAIYYLGNIGTDRARQALVKIVRGEK